MPTGRINKTNVDALFATSGQAFLWDEDLRGFGVKASASGAKSYLVQYRDGNFGWKADAAGTSPSQPNIEPT